MASDSLISELEWSGKAGASTPECFRHRKAREYDIAIENVENVTISCSPTDWHNGPTDEDDENQLNNNNYHNFIWFASNSEASNSSSNFSMLGSMEDEMLKHEEWEHFGDIVNGMEPLVLPSAGGALAAVTETSRIPRIVDMEPPEDIRLSSRMRHIKAQNSNPVESSQCSCSHRRCQRRRIKSQLKLHHKHESARYANKKNQGKIKHQRDTKNQVCKQAILNKSPVSKPTNRVHNNSRISSIKL